MVDEVIDDSQQSASSPTMNPIPQELKKPSDKRRSNKPIMEKKRRARINNSLDELKSLILDFTNKDSGRQHSKIEKACVLEMTVKHLRSQITRPDRFSAGYKYCLEQISKFQGIDPSLRRRLTQHLEECYKATSERSAGISATPLSVNDERSKQHSDIFLSVGRGSGIRVVPMKLTNGEIAYVVPAGVNAGSFGMETMPTLAPLSSHDSTSVSSESRSISPTSSGWGSPSLFSEEPGALALATSRPEHMWRPW